MTFYELLYCTAIKNLDDDTIIYCGNMEKQWYLKNKREDYDYGNIYDFQLVTDWDRKHPHTLGRVREEYKNLDPLDEGELEMDIDDGYIFRPVNDFLIVDGGVVLFAVLD